jgi:uncharacterized integral membrane protein
MAFGYLVVAFLAAVVAIFALQNGAPVGVRFLVWTLRDVPLAALLLVAFALGLVLSGLPLWFARWRLARRVRALEARITQLEPPAPDRDH